MDLRMLDAARHEIAHALVVVAVGWSLDVVTIDALRISGRCSYSFRPAGEARTCDELMRDLCVTLAPMVGPAWSGQVGRGQCNTDMATQEQITHRIFAHMGEDTARVLAICGDFAHDVLAVHAAAWDRASVVLAISGRLSGHELARIDPAFIPRRGGDLPVMTPTAALTAVAP